METGKRNEKSECKADAVFRTENGLYCYKYPHAAITADCVIFGFDGKSLHILLIERGLEPFKGEWALPGGFMRVDETIESTASRELFEETGLKDVYMTQIGVYSQVDRDPRERVVTIAFMALVRPADYNVVAGDDAAKARWFLIDELPHLAFDHDRIVADARKYLSEVIRIKPLVFNLLDKVFTLGELQRVYEVITGTSYDRRNFAKKALQTGYIKEMTVENCCEVGACPPKSDISMDAEKDMISSPPPGSRQANNLIQANFSPSGLNKVDALDFFRSRGDAAYPQAARKSAGKGRRPSKLFSFFKPSGKKEDDGSTKDIFNF